MEALKERKFQHSVCFTAFDGEEQGLVGSHHMADNIKAKAELRNNYLGAVISDMSTGFKESVTRADRPSGYDSENSILSQGVDNPQIDGIHIDSNSHGSKLIAKVLAATKRVVSDKEMPILTSEASIWNSDQKSFQQDGLAAVDICAANHRIYPYWHHVQNTTDNLDPRIGTEISRAAVASAFSIARRLRGARDMEEEEHPSFASNKVVPSFDRAEQFIVSDAECSRILQEREATVTEKSSLEEHHSLEEHDKDHNAKSDSNKDHAKAHAKARKHSAMSLELAKELEETLLKLEESLKTATN